MAAADFTDILSAEQISSAPQDLAHYGRDWCKSFEPSPRCILLPARTEQVQAIIRRCAERRLALVPSGGRTGLSGGATATAGEVVLSMERMNKVLEVNPIDRTLRCEAGAVTQKVQEEAQRHNLFFPLEFTTKASSQIGGNIATNVGGIRVLRYGNIREWVLGLRAVTGSGELLNLNGSLFKNNTGYDLRNLLIASEGTLAVIVEATLRLTRPPEERRRVLAGIEDTDRILSILRRTRERFEATSAFEYFTAAALEKVLLHHKLQRPFPALPPHLLLIEIECGARDKDAIDEFFAGLLEEGVLSDAVIAQSEKQAGELLEMRERIGETLSSHYCPHKNDLSVPVPSIPAFMRELEALLAREYPGFEMIIFGHVGDGNLHVNTLKPEQLSRERFFELCHEADEKVFELVRSFGGSISAEHGIGLLKKPFLHHSRSAAEVELMRGIKRIFDPAGILNPGKIFDS